MSYAIKFPNGTYLNRTVKCGAFHGRIPKTAQTNQQEARLYTRKQEAKSMIQVLKYRTDREASFLKNNPERMKKFQESIDKERNNIPGIDKAEVIKI